MSGSPTNTPTNPNIPRKSDAVEWVKPRVAPKTTSRCRHLDQEIWEAVCDTVPPGQIFTVQGLIDAVTPPVYMGPYILPHIFYLGGVAHSRIEQCLLRMVEGNIFLRCLGTTAAMPFDLLWYLVIDPTDPEEMPITTNISVVSPAGHGSPRFQEPFQAYGKYPAEFNGFNQ